MHFLFARCFCWDKLCISKYWKTFDWQCIFLRNHDRIFAWILTQPKIFVGFKGMLNDVFETPGKLGSLVVASPKKMPENRCLKLQEKEKLPWEPNDLLISRGYNLLLGLETFIFHGFWGPKVPGSQERSFAQHPCVSLLVLKPYSICMHLVDGSCFFQNRFPKSFFPYREIESTMLLHDVSYPPATENELVAGCWILEDEKRFQPWVEFRCWNSWCMWLQDSTWPPYIYLHLVDLYGKLVGRYTIHGFCGYFMTSNGFHSSRFMITAPFWPTRHKWRWQRLWLGI